MTNDPVMTPELLDYFFNQRTKVFVSLDERDRTLLHSIYDLPEYRPILPIGFSDSVSSQLMRQHKRYSFKCSGIFNVEVDGLKEVHELTVFECSEFGFLARSKTPLNVMVWGNAVIQLGKSERSRFKAQAVGAKQIAGFYGFKLIEPDLAWRKFVSALKSGQTHEDMANATQFLRDWEE